MMGLRDGGGGYIVYCKSHNVVFGVKESKPLSGFIFIPARDSFDWTWLVVTAGAIYFWYYAIYATFHKSANKGIYTRRSREPPLFFSLSRPYHIYMSGAARRALLRAFPQMRVCVFLLKLAARGRLDFCACELRACFGIIALGFFERGGAKKRNLNVTTYRARFIPRGVYYTLKLYSKFNLVL